MFNTYVIFDVSVATGKQENSSALVMSVLGR